MIGLVFGGTFRFDINDPAHPTNDLLIFSKGHASPLRDYAGISSRRIVETVMRLADQLASPTLSSRNH